MRALFLLGLLTVVPSGTGVTQGATPTAQQAQTQPPADLALVRKFIDADSAARKALVDTVPDVRTAEFRVAVQRLATEHSKQGRVKEAVHAYEAAIELAGLVDAPRTRIGSLISLGMVYGQTGDYTTAARHLSEALAETVEGRDDDLIAAGATNLANVYRRRGEYDKALEVQERALASNIAAKREPQVARALNNIGMIHERKGDFRQAVDYYLRSLELKERLDLQDDIITTLGNIGNIHALQGNYPQALEYMERSLALAEKTNNVRLTIGMVADIGRILSDSGEYDAAEIRLHRARLLAEKVGYAEQLATTLTALGNLEIERRRWTQASGYLARAQTILVDGSGDPTGLGQVLMSMARIELERGRPAAGVPLAKEARDKMASVGAIALADAEVLYGEALTSLGRWDDAIATFDRAVVSLERSLDLIAGDTEDRYRFLDSAAQAYAGLVHAYAAAGRPSEALAAAERGRARTLLDMLAAGHAGESDLSEAERNQRIELDTALSALNERISATREAGGTGLDPALTAEVDRVRKSRDEFYLGLDARHPQLRFARGGAPVLNQRDLAATLPPKSALVEFVVGPRGAWVIVLTPRAGREPRLVVKAAGLPASRLTRLAATFTRQVATRDLAFSANARALYDALFGGIESELTGVEQVIVVPHGTLWEVPFQALRTPRQRYLVEEYAVAYAPSASALKALEARRRPRPAQPRVVAFGDPRLSDAKAPPLPHAAREARDVAAVYGNAAVVATSLEASEARFRQLAPGADIVHIATHGVLDNSSPLFSYVMLAGKDGAKPADGRLEGQELINMQLGAELVVLSACDTARGRISNGEGVVGLSWALFAAGASTTAVSLWPVDSASTTELMSAFHRERRRLTTAAAPAATAKALRAAQLRSLERIESRHPFYWAGFVVIGVP